MNEHSGRGQISHNTSLESQDDSILDFKSPRQSPRIKLIELNQCIVYRKDKTAVTLKNSIKNQKVIKHKQHLGKKENLHKSQPSIESSFFKSKNNCDDKTIITDVKVALVCPLCFKTFKDLNSHTLHMKICAYKYKIPTKKLLDAIELQKRQEDERQSLGLPVAPIVQNKKKPTLSCKMSSYEETDLQLALALSKSLQETEELDIINEIERSPKTLNQMVPEANKLIYEGKLEKFGFANSKPPLISKNKRRKNNEITILQTRSQEERNYILTEKISEILMGNELVTQNQIGEIKYNVAIEKKRGLRSCLLQEFYNKEEKLWNKAKLSPNQKCFYVTELLHFITPEEKQIVIETILEYANTSNTHDVELNQYKTKLYNDEKIQEMSCAEVNVQCENCHNTQFLNSIITNWGDALNDSSASDIIIFVNSGKHIWAHKLVLYVQCSNILLDITPNDTLLCTTIKDKISWTDVSYNIALAFLEFIYCGTIKKYLSVLDNVTNFAFLRNLARRYRVKRLFAFLEGKNVNMKQVKTLMHNKQEQELNPRKKDNLELTNNNVENLTCDIKDSKLDDDMEKLNKKHLEKYIIDKSEFVEIELQKDDVTEELLHKEINCLKDTNSIRIVNASPDLFDDVNDILQSKEENINLLADTPYFTTPKKEKCPDKPRIKSNLSIFIEQVQKENARSDVDVDSEVLILPTYSEINRNPFNIKENNSPVYSISQTNTIVKESFKTKKDILETFDCVANSNLNKKKLHEKNDENTSSSLESINNIIQSSEYNVQICTEKYKNDLMYENMRNLYQDLQHKIVYSVPEDRLKRSIEVSENLQNGNQEDTFSDFDTGEESMYSKYKKGHEINSIIKYRNFVQEHILKNNEINNTTFGEYEDKNSKDNNILLLDTDKETGFKTSLVKRYDEDETKNIIFNFKKCKKTSLQNLCSHSSMCSLDKYNCSFTNVMPLSTQKNTFKKHKPNNSNKLRSIKSESNIDLQAIRKNSLTLAESNTNKYDSEGSVVSVPSSPESDYNVLNVYKYEENKTNKSVLYSENSDNNSNFKNDIHLANIYIDNSDDNINTSPISKKIVSNITANENENKLSIINNSFTKQLKHNKKSLTTRKYSRKIQKKSVLEKSLYINTDSVMPEKFEFYNNSQCKCNYKKEIEDTALPKIIRDSVTPPPNYNDMKTFELQVS
ncbi:hypothetical protein WN48_00431 [Eufriesea mexicana]|nr:hypothetical protein WN48_00431 [Eufriesea mexicana]